MDFYSAGVRPPDQLVADDFLLRPLRTVDVDLDYDAVMENPAALRLSSGGAWPADDFTLEENLIDLAEHENEHNQGVAFTYTMVNRDQNECLGCVYVNQLTTTYRLVEMVKPVTIDARHAIVRYWVRQSRVKDDLDWGLLHALIGWFSDEWRLSTAYFRAHEDDERQRFLMAEAALPHSLTLELQGRRGRFLAFGPVATLDKEGSR
jgi:RimJ/RimL family protein N-acetyltransferase